MFGSNRKEIEVLKQEHKKEVEGYLSEIALLKERVAELEASTSEEVGSCEDKKELANLLIESYKDGADFLHMTIESPLVILDEVNNLNAATV